MTRSLVINAGSSSVKFQVFDGEKSILSGLCDAIGNEHSKIVLKHDGEKEVIEVHMKDHSEAFHKLVDILNDKGYLEDVHVVAHRVLHGGEKFSDTILVNDKVIEELKKLISLGPLHMPANISGIEMMTSLLPSAKQFAIFDTAFHSHMPEKAYLYGVPYSWYKKHGVRRYGFHGSSHGFVIQETKKYLGNDKAKIISCHLGNGCSVCAYDGENSVDTSMGLTPLEGSVMGTRSGSIDPSIIFHVAKNENIEFAEIENILNKKSGLLGLSEISSDMRTIEEGYIAGKPEAVRALDVFIYQLVKIIGGYVAALNGVDAIIFTGGIGEMGPIMRELIMKNFDYLGVEMDVEKNNSIKGKFAELSTKNSKVKVLVVPTNEELHMVRSALNCRK